ncbi:MAG: hypothetical protein ACI9XC_002669, partial [Gammaproteobacteria bacterium]
AGFSGIVDIIWDAVFQKRIIDRLSDGKRLSGIEARLEKTVKSMIYNADENKGRRCYIGHTIHEKSSSV